MKISKAWLNDYVNLSSVQDAELENLITTRIAEVDDVFIVQEALEDAIVVLIKDVHPVEGGKKLSLATVNIGKGKDVQVVCGASNCRVGMLTAYIPPKGRIQVGEKLITVEEKAVAGIVSCGVLAAEDELGLTSDHSGIMELDAIAKREKLLFEPGDKLSKFFGGRDTVFEIDNKSLTHRPDLWSHFGFAKEISAILSLKNLKLENAESLKKIDTKLKINIDEYIDDKEAGKKKLEQIASAGVSAYSVQISANTPCSRFLAIEILNVKNEISPTWMRKRLHAVGAGVRTLLVDLSNYVMHDVGQPNHAYDADRIVGKRLIARMAGEGEAFTALDGENYKLTASDMVIADDNGAVALAGVMGGERSSIYDTTNHLYLESACFDYVSVRLTTKRHAIRTDASNRFEKSRSSFAASAGLIRFVEILRNIQPEIKVIGAPCDAFLVKPEKIIINGTRSYIRSRLGVEVSDRTINDILTALSFKFVSSIDDEFSVEVPTERATKDIMILDDLVEEIGRIYGYENIPPCSPTVCPEPPQDVKIRAFEYTVGDTLVSRGFSEVYNYSFMNGEEAQKLGYDLTKTLKLQNAVDVTESDLRPSLIPNLVHIVNETSKTQAEIYLFEIGRTYSAEFDKRHENLVERGSWYPQKSAKKFKIDFDTKLQEHAPFERRMLGVAYSSGIDENTAGALLKPAVNQGADFYSLVETLRKLAWISSDSEFKLEAITTKDKDYVSWMHPYRVARVILNNVCIGYIAEAKQEIFTDLTKRTVFAEIDLELLMEVDKEQKKTVPISKFPDSFFEMSIVIPKEVNYSDLKEFLLSNTDKKFLKKLEPLSVYTGVPLKDDEKSIAVKFSFGLDERTLSREEVETLQNALMDAVANSKCYSLRGM